MIVKNSLGFNSNLFVYQDKDMFNYSVDTILLANFMTINTNTKNVLEVGTNNGALAIFLSERYSKLQIEAIEVIKEALDIAKKNVKLNKKQNQITLMHEDFNNLVTKKTKTQAKKYDGIVCNPPFYKVDSSIKRKGSEFLYLATHEVKLTLEQLIKGSAKIIKQKGYLSIVLPTERIVDAFEYMRKYGFEPKRVQMIYPRINDKASLVLIEGRFRVGWGVHFLSNIYLHPENINDHEYRNEIKKLYKPIKVKESK